jgi:Tfp pilus assembly protein PilF
VLIQLKQAEGDEAQLEVFRRALQEVPKSGEVWNIYPALHLSAHYF